MFPPLCHCCCSPRRIANIVSILDLLIGCITVTFCIIAAVYRLFLETEKALEQEMVLLLCGLISIFLMGLVSLWSADKQLDWIKNGSEYKKRPRAYAIRFWLFLFTEILGWAVPYVLIQNYTEQIDTILAFSPLAFGILVLLKLNPITVSLMIFQLYSFYIIRYYIQNVTQIRSEALEAVLADPRVPEITYKPKSRSTDIPMQKMKAKSNRRPLNCASDSDCSNFESDLKFSKSRLSEQVDSEEGAVKPPIKVTASKLEYKLLKSRCLAENALYEDPDFPPCPPTELGSFQWKRPHEICKHPKFISNGVSRFDIKQGKIGDCYFLAAVANLTLNEKLFNNVVPTDNSWENGRSYTGICHFRFFVSGAWKDVIIDDRLPTRDGKRICLRSADKNEFWSSLLEKAYAKLHGGYQVLNRGGNAGDAMVELTGGSVATYRIRSPATVNIGGVSSSIERALRAGHLVTCSTDKKNDERNTGLTPKHVYSISDVKRIDVAGRGQVDLIRIRNPWGNQVEWIGDWSDRACLWNLVDKITRRELKLRFAEDGEFWFPIKEFAEHFDVLEICYLKSV